MALSDQTKCLPSSVKLLNDRKSNRECCKLGIFQWNSLSSANSIEDATHIEYCIDGVKKILAVKNEFQYNEIISTVMLNGDKYKLAVLSDTNQISENTLQNSDSSHKKNCPAKFDMEHRRAWN